MYKILYDSSSLNNKTQDKTKLVLQSIFIMSLNVQATTSTPDAYAHVAQTIVSEAVARKQKQMALVPRNNQREDVY